MKRFACICLLFACGAAAPAAAGQSSTATLVAFGNLEGASPVSTTTIPADMSGQLTVSFHGDPATGCAAQGICGYSGTLLFHPGSQGEVLVNKYRTGGRFFYQVGLDLTAGPGTPFTAARVRRAGGGICSDAQPLSSALTGAVTGHEVAIGMVQPQGGLLSTRCAGPLDADLAGLGPQIRLSLGQLLRGRRAIPLSGTWSFAAGGFAGTIDSGLNIALKGPQTQLSPGAQRFPRGIKTQRQRRVTETLAVVNGNGNTSLGLSGDPAACQFLDSCGIQGSLSETLAPSQTEASLLVVGPAKRPYRDFLTALGLSRSGNPRGLLVQGSVGWLAGGTMTEQLQQGASCTSSVPLPGGFVLLHPSGRGLTASYSPLASPRARCPGPELGQSETLASGSLSLSAIRQATFSIHLSGSGSLADDGYTMSQHTSLTLTLKRGRVHQETLLAPTG